MATGDDGKDIHYSHYLKYPIPNEEISSSMLIWNKTPTGDFHESHRCDVS